MESKLEPNTSAHQGIIFKVCKAHGIKSLELTTKHIALISDCISEYIAQQPQTSPEWVKADTKPEHNVGVLVFIPGEDNHITSGMWDISNKWVLLDEYRTPDEEVTHWMLLPAFPHGYTWNEIPNELKAALKEVAKEQGITPAGESETVDFITWLWKDYRPVPSKVNEWLSTKTLFGKPYTTAQLYQLFKQQKEK